MAETRHRTIARCLPTARIALPAAVAVLGLGAAVAAVPAGASLTGPGVESGQNITVFHNIDFVGVFGYGPVGTTVTVDVIRDGVRVGTATGPTVDTPEGPGLEVNHGPVGAAQPGDCWTGTTPDIRPGDRIVVTEGSDTDEVTVDALRFSGAPVEDPATGDVLVRGTALRADGRTIAPSALDSGEFRDDSGRLRAAPSRVEATPGVTGGFTMRYTAPYDLERNRDGLSQAQVEQALLTQDGHAAGFGHTVPLPLESMLLDGLADVPGPALGCEASPAAGGTAPAPASAPADTTAPVVLRSSPASGATSVARTANTTVTFSESVTGVSASTVRLRDPRGATVSAAVTYNAATGAATLDPASSLKARTTYTVSLTAGIADAAGNALAPTSWTFTTAAK